MGIGDFCTRDVAIVAPDDTVLEAARVMRDQHVGDVIVVERQADRTIPVGIITDRDIVIEVLAREVPLDAVAVKDLLSRELITAQESDAVTGVVERMRHNGVRRIPVINDQGGLEGIFSLDDLLELLAEQLNDLVAITHKEIHHEQEKRP